MISSYRLDDNIASVTFKAGRDNGIASGYNLKVVFDHVTSTAVKTVDVEVLGKNSGTFTFGSEKGISLSMGRSMTRTSQGSTSTSVDPIVDLFKKSVIMTQTRSSLYEYVEKAGDSKNKNKIVFVSSSQLQLANAYLSAGNIQGYCTIMMGLTDSSANNVHLDFSKAEESPIIANLKESGTIKWSSGDTNNRSSLFHLSGGIASGTIMTVEDIFRKILAPLGLELYWIRDNMYSLEPPRIANDNSETVVTIRKEDIISLDTESNPYSTPSLIIPVELEDDIIGKASTIGLQYIVDVGILNGDDESTRSLKIETYNIPSFLVNPLKNAITSTSIARNKSIGAIAEMTTSEATGKYELFYGDFARKTSLYERSNGSCMVVFNPSLTIPYAWYNINGIEAFVTSVIHTITRSKATTLLTIAAMRDTSTGESAKPKPNANRSKEAKESEDKVVKEIADASALMDRDYVRTIDQKVQQMFYVHKDKKETHHDVSGDTLSADEVDKIFGSQVDEDSVLEQHEAIHPKVVAPIQRERDKDDT